MQAFKLKGSDLATANSLSITAPTNATIILNINGTSDRMQYMGISLSGGIKAETVIFNFYQATSLTVNGVNVPGTI